MISLKSKHDCCGCSACVQACPKQCIIMVNDEEGFLYPQIDIDTCINCNKCEQVCPIINQNSHQKPIASYAAKNKNDQIRLMSSSGGIFTLLAEKTINNNGVVFGAKFNDNWDVIHDYTEKLDGIIAFRGSKYVQSQIGDNYKKTQKFLQEGREVIFSGTPCQIAGLHRFLNKTYLNLITIDIICHGVPSPMVWQKYIQRYHQKQITDILFRDKTNGWKDYEFVISSGQHTIIREKRANNVFMNLFLSDLCLRPSCSNCPAKKGSSHSDITIADFWGIEHVIPTFDDDKGCNLVLINSIKGADIFNSLDCEKVETNFDDAIKHNASYYKSVSEPKYRSYFFENFDKKGFDVYNSIKRKHKTCLSHHLRINIKLKCHKIYSILTSAFKRVFV